MYVFERIDGTWIETDQLHISMPEWNYIGNKTLLSEGDVMMTVAHHDSEPDKRMIVFERVNGVWIETGYFAHEGYVSGAFGESGTINEGKILLGAYSGRDWQVG